MTYRGFALGSPDFISSATHVKVVILEFVFYFKYLSLSVWKGVGVLKTLNDKSLPG